MDNVVSCCSVCNIAKGTMDVGEFLDWIRKVAAYQRKVFKKFLEDECDYGDRSEPTEPDPEYALPVEFDADGNILRPW